MSKLPNPWIDYHSATSPAETAAAVPATPRPEAAAVPVLSSDGNDVPARMQESNGRKSGLARDDVKPDDTMQESRPAHLATTPSEAFPSSPALGDDSPNYGESDPVAMPDSGAGGSAAARIDVPQT